MPGDPHECRQHALNCERLAEQAATPEMRETFLGLAKTWTKLAGELEAAKSLLDGLNKLDGEPSSLLPGYDVDSSQP